jgi:hypothetical protein
MFEKSLIFFSSVYGNLTILGDLLQTEKAKLQHPWDKIKTCEGFFTIQLPWISIQVLVREPYIVSCSYKNSYIIAFKNIMNMITFFSNRRQKVGKLGTKSRFSLLNNILLCNCLKSVYGHPAVRCVK